MRYVYVECDPNRYATNLQYDQSKGNLTWEAKGADTLVIQTPFKMKATDCIIKVIESLNESKNDIRNSTFMEVLPNVWVLYVSMAEKARNKGCVLNGEASTYTVFACTTRDDVCTIHAPQEQAMITPWCDVPMQLQINIERMRNPGFLRSLVKGNNANAPYVVQFPKDCAQGYIDGDICYIVEEADNIEIPITKTMLEEGQIFIRTRSEPKFKSLNPGINLVSVQQE